MSMHGEKNHKTVIELENYLEMISQIFSFSRNSSSNCLTLEAVTFNFP